MRQQKQAPPVPLTFEGPHFPQRTTTFQLLVTSNFVFYSCLLNPTEPINQKAWINVPTAVKNILYLRQKQPPRQELGKPRSQHTISFPPIGGLVVVTLHKNPNFNSKNPKPRASSKGSKKPNPGAPERQSWMPAIIGATHPPTGHMRSDSAIVSRRSSMPRSLGCVWGWPKTSSGTTPVAWEQPKRCLLFGQAQG